MNGIDKITIRNGSFIYNGTVPGLPNDKRATFITPTYYGCHTMCGSAPQLNTPGTALGLVTTWVFPFAILLSLPYESSIATKKVRRTVIAVLNWLGSPQTSLTATIDNFLQIRRCHRRVKDEEHDKAWNNLLYVVSVFNQFDLPSRAEQEDFIRALVYGLYCTVNITNSNQLNRPEVRLTRDLLSELASQLRLLRRKGVIPTLASLATFLVAFVFSVVLSFAAVGKDATVSPLVLGLGFGWLPTLVIFAIVDRNPVSSVRSAVLMSRWLFNVNAIHTCFSESALGDVSRIQWWTAEPSDNDQPGENTAANMIAPEDVQTEDDAKPDNESQDLNGPQSDNATQQGSEVESGECEVIDDRTPFKGIPPAFRVGEFIGQGRRMQYSGLASAVLENIDSSHFGHHLVSCDSATSAIVRRLNGRRPAAWFVTACVSLFLVFSQLAMAFMLAYNTPSVGLGCWSGGYVVYAFLSSISWIVQLFCKRPGRWTRFLCHTSNGLAFCFLIAFTLAMLTGAFNSCFCMTLFGRSYMNFESSEFYLKFFHVGRYWIGATVIGGLVPFISFLWAVFGWLKCQHLWTVNETGRSTGELKSREINSDWLRYN
ncbi:hypothetical protein BDV96DRAFT_648772 [Lophiotrema nucula]|uniref:Uncharacterized protein n=1 Tax=Lophiotrema nucula TaxID=690887 RepID=A0A6A5YZE9_9PLEO|nr:hypothetical protein BDV96DRAFT_648772 [Lophiotrema nucula]